MLIHPENRALENVSRSYIRYCNLKLTALAVTETPDPEKQQKKKKKRALPDPPVLIHSSETDHMWKTTYAPPQLFIPFPTAPKLMKRMEGSFEKVYLIDDGNYEQKGWPF